MAFETNTGAQLAGARVARRARRPDTYAALDLGTNNCRLLVATQTPRGFRVVDAFSRVVRLGEGVAERGRLSPPAMARAIDALGVCARKMRRRGVTHARGVTTEACRRADNTPAFIARVRAETGLDLEVIDAAEEARLAVVGCRPLFVPGQDRAVIFDIGGGSTQIIWLALDDAGEGVAPRTRILASTSLPCGVVSLAERFGQDGEACFSSIRQYVMDLLSAFDRAHDIQSHIAAGRVQMVGTSGTVTTLGGVLLDLPRYERARVDGLSMSFVDIARISERLASMDVARRAAVPCIGTARADLVVIGCAVLDAICRTWPVGRLRVADRGLREGILLGLMARAGAGEQNPAAP